MFAAGRAASISGGDTMRPIGILALRIFSVEICDQT
jgi:hypothetical protein